MAKNKKWCSCPCLDLQRERNEQGTSIGLISEYNAFRLIELSVGPRNDRG